MEHIHGIDVSWMTHGSSKDSKAPKPTSRRRNTIQSQTSPPPDLSPAGSPRTSSPIPIPTANSNDENTQLSSSLPTSPISVRGRRPSWFSNISSKFSTSPGSSPPQATNTSPKQAELSVPRANPAKNAVLQHAARIDGEGPYTPAPVKTSQAGLLQVFRRLSSSGGNFGTGVKGSHGLVERRVLNVDRNRERCQLAELNHAKLRRVAFCVDVEIAPMPRYKEDATADNSAKAKPAEKTIEKVEKGEGDALKAANAPDATQQKPDFSKATASLAAAVPATSTPTPAATQAKPKPIPETTATKSAPAATNGSPPQTGSSPPSTADVNRKKEKKKRSEEERKARKERKRRQAEANGTIPMEIYLDSDDSDNGTKKDKPSTAPAAPRAQLTPTTNPVRIYRRCCQLRETPILRKITEQLSDPAMFSAEHGIVTKLDLTGYWLQLADLTTLGDFLAVVPIREVILENCGLNDEGLRVILSGLLAARKPQKKHIHLHHYNHHQQRSTVSATKNTSVVVPATVAAPNGHTNQGGFVERLVLKNNKIGVEGWKHVCLFVYMCHTLKALDVSNVVFPHTLVNKPAASQPISVYAINKPQLQYPYDVCQLLSKSLGERLGGANLELLNIGDTGLTSQQLGWIVDGIIQSGTKRLGLAHNDLDDAGVRHVARYLASGKCEGLDLGGNNLRDRLEVLADAAATNDSLWALSLADCNLAPFPLCKLLPKLVSLSNFKFLDLSHNHELFEARPSATILLRRYLPMMESLKRLHLADVAMNSEQAIALAEIIPEVKELAHLNILQNPQLSKLADARTEEGQEQACAFYASFLAATRLSTSIIAIDMPVPTAESTEIVRAMAKQVLAYCLRNVDRVTLGNPAAPILTGDPKAMPPTNITPETASDSASFQTSGVKGESDYSDVIQHLVGHDAATLGEDDDIDTAPDDDYVIGGTGVAQALECCLKNRGPEITGRPSGELGDFVFDGDTALMEAAGGVLPGPGKAKDMSKHLLQSARKIRLRLQPALQRAKALSAVDIAAYQRLLFLDNTLDGIIKRFEDEFPETRVSIDSGVSVSNLPEKDSDAVASSLKSGSAETEAEIEVDGDAVVVCASDGEDETDILPSRLSRSNSVMSMSSKGLTNEEGRVLRAGHRFRSGWFKHYNLLSGVDEISSNPAHNHVLYELVSDINDPVINKMLSEKGIVRLFKEDREQLLQVLKEQDPEHWERFVESQEKARANLKIELGEGGQVSGSPLLAVDSHENEEAVIDD